MRICLLEPNTPAKIANRKWLSFLFDSEIMPLGEDIDPGLFPLYIVHGSTNVEPIHRSIEFDYFSQLSEAGKQFGFIHVKDENYNHDLSAYKLQGCKIVFREYVRPKGGNVEFLASRIRSLSLPYPQFENPFLASPKVLLKQLKYRLVDGHRLLKRQYLPRLPEKKVIAIPLGYTDAITQFSGSSVPPIENRKYLWSFCGDVYKSDRQKMIKELSNIKPHYTHIYTGFMGVNS